MKDKVTYVKAAKKCICKITLEDLPFWKNHRYLQDASNILPDIYVRLVLTSPSLQINLGTKISKKAEQHIDEIVDCIIKNLDVKNTYFFSSYDSRDTTKENLSPKIKTDSGSYICLYAPNGFLESLYASVRNALAHGNIWEANNFYYLYSVSSKESGADSEKTLTFLLKIHKLQKLNAYITAFENYN